MRKTLDDPNKYQLFLRLIALYNLEIISKNDLMSSLQDALGNNPEILKWVRNFIKFPEDPYAGMNVLNNNATPVKANSVSLAPGTPVQGGSSSRPSLLASLKPDSDGVVKQESQIWMNGRGTRYSEREFGTFHKP